MTDGSLPKRAQSEHPSSPHQQSGSARLRGAIAKQPCIACLPQITPKMSRLPMLFHPHDILTKPFFYDKGGNEK